MDTISSIVEKLQQAREAYYNSDTPLISDGEFDSLEDKLKELDPENPYFSSVGITSTDRKKITHAIPMLSMQKGKKVEEIYKWMDKLKLPEKEELAIMPKIDGLSASCCYEQGKLQYIATRGDGTIGQDISHVVSYIKDIPETITFTTQRIEIRGELYLPKTTSFNTGGRPLRNNCVGLINRKEQLDDLAYVRFAAFQIAGSSDYTRESEINEVLSCNHFNAVPLVTVSTREQISDYYGQYLSSLRSSWEFETDGLVITVNNRQLFEEIDSRWVVDHHHHYAIALKPPAEAVETELIKIDWQVSRQGNVIPVAVFNPVIIGGAKIERASLNNYDNVVRLDILIGDILLIERANDVIPYVRENISASSQRDAEKERPLITHCPSCSHELEKFGVHIRCINSSCPETNIQKIIYWIKSSDMEQIGNETVRFLYNKGLIRSVHDLFSLSYEQLIELEGFAEKKTRSIINEIQNSRTMSSLELISKLGIPLVQKRSLKKLGINSLEEFYSFNNDEYVIGQNIIEWKKNRANMDFLSDLITTCTITDETEKKAGLVCMTGKGPKGRKELAEDIEHMGYEFTNQLTQETSILLTDNPEGSSSKLAKARKFGVTIMSYETFFNKSL